MMFGFVKNIVEICRNHIKTSTHIIVSILTIPIKDKSLQLQCSVHNVSIFMFNN